MRELGPVIYRRDLLGNVRTWQYEVEDNLVRTHTGILHGAIVTSEWRECRARSQPTPEDQAMFQAMAAMKRKLERDYRRTVEEIDTPLFFKPMLAQKYQRMEYPCYSQPKLDGVRAIATKDGLFSRAGKRLYGAPHIEAALAPVFDMYQDTMLDGELYNHDYKDDFNSIISAVRKQKLTEEDIKRSKEIVQYHVFDMPSEPFLYHMRYNKLLSMIVHPWTPIVPLIFCETEAQVDGAYQLYLSEGYEGQMIRYNGMYEQRRSHLLLKRKEFIDQEFPVVELREGQGNWGGIAKVAVCLLPDGRTFKATLKGAKTDAPDMFTDLASHATVRYLNLTPDGIPRMPVAVALHYGERI